MKIYDLSQPLNQDCSFWPFYPPFEVKYIKRKAEHGVNAQYIMTSNHMGTHLDAPRHFVTHGRTIDQIPVEWMWGPGVIVDVSDICDDLALFTPRTWKPAQISATATFYSFTLAGTSTLSSVRKVTRSATSSATPGRTSASATGC